MGPFGVFGHVAAGAKTEANVVQLFGDHVRELQEIRPHQLALLVGALVGVRIARYYVLMTASLAAGLWDWLRRGTPAEWEKAEGTR